MEASERTTLGRIEIEHRTSQKPVAKRLLHCRIQTGEILALDEEQCHLEDTLPVRCHTGHGVDAR